VNSPGFLILIVAFGFLWFVLIRPQKRRQLEAARTLNAVQVGSEVLTAGGIYGEVTEVHDDDVMVRIAPDLEVRVARKAIGAVIPPPEPDDAAEPGDAEPVAEADEPPKPENES
jgi:preprotein translocase subunit YajC